MNELMLISAVWCVSIYGAVQGLKMALKSTPWDKARYERFIPVLPMLVGIGSGFAMVPEVWTRLGLETPVPISAILLIGSGAGSSSAWVYGLVKHSLQRESESGS